MNRTSGGTIDSLLVEDNPGDARLIEAGFEELGLPIDIHTVTNGSAALDYLERRAQHQGDRLPDVIFLDLGLPGPSGWEFLDEIWESDSSALRSIPVIIITNSQAEQDMFDSLDNEQVHAYFSKPYDPEGYVDLARSVVDFLTQEQGLREEA